MFKIKRSHALLLSCIIALSGCVEKKVSDKSLVVEAESGIRGSDVLVSTDGDIVYITPKTNYEDWSTPGDTFRIVTYTVAFPDTGCYNLYARVRVGKETKKDDSFFVGKGFGMKDLARESWILVNELGYWAFNENIEVGDSAASSGIEGWRWINVTQGFCKATEADSIFCINDGDWTKTFQVSTREDGLWIDKFVFGKVGLTFTAETLDNVLPDGKQ